MAAAVFAVDESPRSRRSTRADHQELQRSAHRSVNELATDSQPWLDDCNENRTPFVWHKAADEIHEHPRRLPRRRQPGHRHMTHTISRRFSLKDTR